MADITVTATVDEDLWNRAKAQAGGDDATVLAAALHVLVGAGTAGAIASTYEVPSAAPETEADQEMHLQVGT